MAYGDNKQQNRSIADVLSDFTKFQHDNLTNERNYNQNVLNNMATIGKYQRYIRTENMFMKRANATQRFLEAEQFARTETDESKLPKWLEIMNQARREIGSTKDNKSGFEQEGMLRELTMDDLLSIRRMDQMEKKANGEIPTGGRPIADKIKDLGGVTPTNNSTQNNTDTDQGNNVRGWPFDIYGDNANRNYVNASGNEYQPWMSGTGSNYAQSGNANQRTGSWLDNNIDKYQTGLNQMSNLLGNKYDEANTRKKKFWTGMSYLGARGFEYGNMVFNPIVNYNRAIHATTNAMIGVDNWWNNPLDKE